MAGAFPGVPTTSSVSRPSAQEERHSVGLAGKKWRWASGAHAHFKRIASRPLQDYTFGCRRRIDFRILPDPPIHPIDRLREMVSSVPEVPCNLLADLVLVRGWHAGHRGVDGRIGES